MKRLIFLFAFFGFMVSFSNSFAQEQQPVSAFARKKAADNKEKANKRRKAFEKNTFIGQVIKTSHEMNAENNFRMSVNGEFTVTPVSPYFLGGLSYKTSKAVIWNEFHFQYEIKPVLFQTPLFPL